VWADEVERVLTFLESEGQFDRFLPRLRDQNGEHRNAALGEGRAALILNLLGFTFVGWEPEAIAGKPGEFEIESAPNERVFVEVKSPSWRGEVWLDSPTATEEQKRERVDKEKYLESEGRFVGPTQACLRVIRENALPKLAADRSNLVVVVDDLFVSPVGMPGLDEAVTRGLHDPAFERVGGVLFLVPDASVDPVTYRVQFVSNESALPECAIREADAKLLRKRDRVCSASASDHVAAGR
jgi:hypothetical protein